MGNERFKKVYTQGKMNVLTVYVDTQTGVNYLVANNGGTGLGITPLLDKYGKPVVTPVNE